MCVSGGFSQSQSHMLYARDNIIMCNQHTYKLCVCVCCVVPSNVHARSHKPTNLFKSNSYSKSCTHMYLTGSTVIQTITMVEIIHAHFSVVCMYVYDCLLYLHHRLHPKTVNFVAVEILTSQMYQLFFPYISWDKYYQTPTLFMVVLFTKWPS